MRTATLLLIALFVLAGCGGKLPPPNWQMNAVSLLEHAQQRWLEGDAKAAEAALAKARSAIAQSGRRDLLARAELVHCAARIASLEYTRCESFDRLAIDAHPDDVAYARFLRGDWRGLDAKSLPSHYAALLGAREDVAANRAVAAIKEPLPRLIAAALLFQAGRAEPATLVTAIDSASERGWRRPLLAWLQVQRQRALAAGEADAASLIQRRIELVLTAPSTP